LNFRQCVLRREAYRPASRALSLASGFFGRDCRVRRIDRSNDGSLRGFTGFSADLKDWRNNQSRRSQSRRPSSLHSQQTRSHRTDHHEPVSQESHIRSGEFIERAPASSGSARKYPYANMAVCLPY
jgi:hypothetical protein